MSDPIDWSGWREQRDYWRELAGTWKAQADAYEVTIARLERQLEQERRLRLVPTTADCPSDQVRTGRSLTTACEVRVVGLELRMEWRVTAREPPRTGRLHGELFRVAALVADLSTDYDWTILVADGFSTREIKWGTGRWRVVTGIRIELATDDGEEEHAKAVAVLDSVAALL